MKEHPQNQSEQWELAWSDEFDYDGLPDPNRWTYEEGFVRNEELQFYTRARRENARVEGGRLILEAHRESIPNPGFDPASDLWSAQRKASEYTSASITTEGLAEFLYGRIEVRAKVPSGSGVWPAIWMLGVNFRETGWPVCGEIDVMEFVGNDPHRIHGNMHFLHPQENKHTSQTGNVHLDPAPSENFHLYAIEWNAECIDFLVDDQRYHRLPLDLAGDSKDNPFRKPHYLLINLAVGGSWGGKTDPSIFPRRYEIDYVRAYRHRNP